MRLVAMVAVAGVVISGCATSGAVTTPASTRDGVRFVLARPEAQTVTLAGSFNEWSASSHPMTRASSGLWTIVVALPPGEHQFMYVVDGAQWISPPLAEDFVDDGFGTRNGVVLVRPDDR